MKKEIQFVYFREGAETRAFRARVATRIVTIWLKDCKIFYVPKNENFFQSSNWMFPLTDGPITDILLLE